MHFERIKINQSTAILTGVDFIDDFFLYQHVLFCMTSSFLALFQYLPILIFNMNSWVFSDDNSELLTENPI